MTTAKGRRAVNGSKGVNPFTAGCAWIDGDFVPIGEARVPILDTGFTRSDLTYDVAAVWKRRFFRVEDHLDRLERSCGSLRLRLPKPRDEIRGLMIECVRHGGFDDAFVEVVVTRGVPLPGDRDPRNATQRLYVYAVPYVWIVMSGSCNLRCSSVVWTSSSRATPFASLRVQSTPA